MGEAVHEAFRPELEALGPAPPPAYLLDDGAGRAAAGPPLCVLMQVRTGDATIQNQGQQVDEAALGQAILKEREGVFQCAELAAEKLAARESAAGWRGSAKDVLWFLMTDSKLLQRAAKERYGHRLLTHNGTVDFYAALGAAGTLSVVGEQWLGTFCSAHVITEKSGIG